MYVLGDTTQLGLNTNETFLTDPKLCNYNILIQQVVCGDAHTLILSKEGYVYSLGSNADGVLGLSQTHSILSHMETP